MNSAAADAAGAADGANGGGACAAVTATGLPCLAPHSNMMSRLYSTCSAEDPLLTAATEH